MTVGPSTSAPWRTCVICTQLPAFGVTDPASVSTSISVELPGSMYLFGDRTSPVTNTLWLRYSITSTDTCGLRR